MDKERFIDRVIEHDVLRFGEFTLKSGRKSPYFFNTGAFNTGKILDDLGQFYKCAILDNGFAPDMLYGPAYKGIPLVSAAAMHLSRATGEAIPYAFNRKEEKDHGELGRFIGAPIAGKVLLIDDVLTAGTAISEAIDLIKSANGQPYAVLVIFDRQEKFVGSNHNAAEFLHNQHQIPVTSIINATDLLNYLRKRPEFSSHYKAIRHYLEQYGQCHNTSI